MKLIGAFAVCKGFAMCRGHMTSNETYSYTQEDTQNDAKFSQIIYVIEGSGILFDHDNNRVRSSGSNEVNDLREFYGKPYKFISGSKGATWICINPFPADKFFDVRLIKQNLNEIIVGSEKENVIVCVKGSITINDKKIEQFKYARILNDKTANIVIDSDSSALHLTR